MQDQNTLTIEEAALESGLSGRTIERAIQSKRLPAVRRRITRTQIERVDFNAWLADRTGAKRSPNCEPLIPSTPATNERLAPPTSAITE
jgi:excisionase family DNA binding protein